MNKGGTPMDLRNKTIVILYMLYFGDMVSLSPFLAVLRRAAKGSRILLVADRRFADAVRYNPNIDRVIEADRQRMGLGGTWNLGKDIGKEKPDILFVLHGTARTTMMALAMHSACWTGEAGTRLDSLFMDRKLLVERKDCHAAEKYVKVLAELGVADTSYEGMEIFTGKEWDQGAADFYASCSIRRGDRLVGLAPGSSTPEKNWPAEHYGAVADAWTDKGYRPVFFGIPSEMPLIERALAVMKHAGEAVVAAGKLSMGEFMAAASWCSIGYANDSGPMYVFDSRGVPTISFFGPSNARLHHPLGKRSCALATTDMPMTQDHLAHTIRDGTYRSISAISVEDALRAGAWAIGEREDAAYSKHYVFVP